MKSSKTAVSTPKRENTHAGHEKTQEQAKFAEIGRVSNRRFYIIRRDSDDWTPIVALISGPKKPTLSTMMKRFDEVLSLPTFPAEPTAESIECFRTEVDAAWARIETAGFTFYAEYFVDWLLKQNAGFERVEYQEVSL